MRRDKERDVVQFPRYPYAKHVIVALTAVALVAIVACGTPANIGAGATETATATDLTPTLIPPGETPPMPTAMAASVAARMALAAPAET